MLKNYYLDYPINYDASQLKSGWAKRNFQIENDSMLAFLGSYKPKKNEQLPANTHKNLTQTMLQIVVEHRRIGDREMLLRRHIFMEIICKTIENNSYTKDGNVFLNQKQVTISQVASNLRASMFHLAFFLRNDLEDPSLLALDQLDFDPKSFAIKIMQSYCRSINELCNKRA